MVTGQPEAIERKAGWRMLYAFGVTGRPIVSPGAGKRAVRPVVARLTIGGILGAIQVVIVGGRGSTSNCRFGW